MDLEIILTILRDNITQLHERGVKGLAIFGPAARNEGAPGSPVDFFLQLHPPHSFDQFFEIKHFLAGALNRPIELTVGNPRHPDIWPFLEEDIIFVIEDS